MENRKVLIDTSILIDHFRKKVKTKTFLANLILNYNLFISIITDYEFRAGSNDLNRKIVNNSHYAKQLLLYKNILNEKTTTFLKFSRTLILLIFKPEYVQKKYA